MFLEKRTFLDKIIANCRKELEARKFNFPLVEMRRAAMRQSAPVDFISALRSKRLGLIAEVKKASPSRGVIRSEFNPISIAVTYTNCGAAAISVLTESVYFQGSINYLRRIGNALGKKKVPLLRKDFIDDPYQIYESRAYGADALLLIVNMLTSRRLKELLELTHMLGMSALVEVHKESELETALGSGARVIGVNNRDLETFEIDLTTTQRLRPLIPEDRIVVSESGIKNRDDIERLKELRVDAVLIGEALLSAPDIPARIKELYGN